MIQCLTSRYLYRLLRALPGAAAVLQMDACAEAENPSTAVSEVQYAYTDAAVTLTSNGSADAATSGMHEVLSDGIGLTLSTVRIYAQESVTDSQGVHGVMTSCGGTFISKHYVLTAGHCVDDEWDRYDYVQGQTVNTTNITNIVAASQVNGSAIGTFSYASPSSQQTLEDSSYFYTCLIVDFCQSGRINCRGTTTGTGEACRPQSCPTEVMNAMKGLVTSTSLTSVLNTNNGWTADVALLYCGNQSELTSWVNAESPTTISGTPVQVRWFHEVVGLPYSNVPDAGTRWTDYGEYGGPSYRDWHYSRLVDGGYVAMFHNVWPIRTRTGKYGTTTWNFTARYNPYDNMVEPASTRLKRFIDIESDYPACHGTSGSGVFTTTSSPYLMGVHYSQPVGQVEGQLPADGSPEYLGWHQLCMPAENLRPPVTAADGGVLIQRNSSAIHPSILAAFSGLSKVTADR